MQRSPDPLSSIKNTFQQMGHRTADVFRIEHYHYFMNITQLFNFQFQVVSAVYLTFFIQ